VSFTGSYITNSFIGELFQGIQVFGTDTFMIALYTSSATLDATTTAYSATNETAGAGYVAGGAALAGFSLGTFNTSNGYIVTLTFSDATWAASTITARGALIYNASKANRSALVLDFGADKTTAGTSFTVQMPPVTANTALIRCQVVPNPVL
jgi:hypothetical protein